MHTSSLSLLQVPGIWPHHIDLFTDFISTLNQHHSSIKLKYSIDKKEINFLDTTVYFQPINAIQKKLFTRVYFKPTDTHSLLHRQSYHPKHTFKCIVKSQIIRFYRISSMRIHFDQAISTLFSTLKSRGYPRRWLRKVKSDTLAVLAPTHIFQSNQHPNPSPPSPHPSPSLTSFPVPPTSHLNTISIPNPNYQDPGPNTNPNPHVWTSEF